MTDAPNMQIGFLMFPGITQLDMTGPFEVLSRLPGAKCHFIWKNLDPIETDNGFRMLPTMRLDEAPQLDVISVPGGFGMFDLLEDEEVLNFLRTQAEGARYVTSVCTGSLVLGAAGLLKGKRAASHWASRDLLSHFGATPVAERVVFDGKFVSGGGVTAGIDFGLALMAEIAGPDVAQAIQLALEYDPHPPFNAGSPETAPKEVVDFIRSYMDEEQQKRAAKIEEIGAKIMASTD